LLVVLVHSKEDRNEAASIDDVHSWRRC
jgi:hypothetical protein